MAANRIAEVVVELLGDVARQLEMLLLVLADRNMGSAIEQNVGRHQHRIIVETYGCVFAIFARLSLNCVIRFSQPTRATQLSIHASSAWPDTWLWLKTMCFF